MATSEADDPQNRPDVWQMYRKRVHAIGIAEKRGGGRPAKMG